MPATRTDIVSKLQNDILLLQGFKPHNNAAVDVGLGSIKNAFPNASFPLGCMHEFLSAKAEHTAATAGFIAGILSHLMGNVGTAFWISPSRTLFPPALQAFGLNPDRIVFANVRKEKEAMWAMEEALTCSALTAVIGEIQDVSFMTSRRLQLAVEKSQVTGFLLRTCQRNFNTTACVSRWNITPLSSDPVEDLPGIGFPKWRVELSRIRNGRPGSWDLKWVNGFQPVHESPAQAQEQQRKTG